MFIKLDQTRKNSWINKLNQNLSLSLLIRKCTSSPSTVSLYPDCTYSLVRFSSGQLDVWGWKSGGPSLRLKKNSPLCEKENTTHEIIKLNRKSTDPAPQTFASNQCGNQIAQIFRKWTSKVLAWRRKIRSTIKGIYCKVIPVI